MNPRIYYSIIFIILSTFWVCAGCSSSSQDDESDSITKIIRIDGAYPADSLANDSDALAGFRAIALSMADTSDISVVIHDYFSSRYFKVFSPDVTKIFSDLEYLATNISRTLVKLHSLTDSIAIPDKVFTYISPFNQQIVRVDDNLLIALNHYLGADYSGYDGFESYRRSMKIPDRIPYDMVEVLVYTSMPFRADIEPTVLQQMIYEGVIVVLEMNAVEHPSLALAIGMSDNDLAWCKANEKRIWMKMVEEDMLFDTSYLLTSKLLDPSAATLVINSEAPGRVGRYIGYRIVQSFLQNRKEVDFDSLLSPSFYLSTDVLADSRFSP